MSWILSLGAGRDQMLLLRAIKNEGHRAAAVDIRSDAEGVSLCDSFKAYSNRDVEAVTAYARWLGVSAIMVAGSEVADVGACASHALGLHGISIAAAIACKDKLWQKQVLMAAGVPCTAPTLVYNGAAKTLFDQFGCKVVVKPRKGSGSRGVTYVDNPMELSAAILNAETIHPDALMEAYCPGPQLSVESLVYDGICTTPCVVDRWYPPGRPVFNEVGGSWPSDHDTAEVHGVMALAAKALGIHQGTLKADMVVTEDGPKIIECTPRLSGGPLATVLYEGSGFDFLRKAVRIALGGHPGMDTWIRRKPVAFLQDWTEVPYVDRGKYICRSPTTASR